MAVDACVQAILCPLAGNVRSTLSAIIQAQIVFLQAEVTRITAALTVVEIQLLPVQVAKGLAETALASVRSVGNLVPVAIMADCFDLGDGMQMLNASLDSASAAVTRVLAEANRLLSFKAELEALRDEINTAIAKLGDIRIAIAGCP